MRHSNCVYRSLVFASVLSIVILPSLAQAIDVPKWSTHTFSFDSGGAYTNGYASGPTSFTATFTGPNGVTKTVPGYWNGGDVFKVRFTPTVEGNWSYTTSSSDVDLRTSGSFTATAPSAGDHGFLRSDPAYPRSFVWDDGTRYFMWGNTYYNPVVTGMQNDNWKAAINGSASYGINKIVLNVYNDFYGTSSGHYDPNSEYHHGYPDVQPYVATADPLVPNRDQLNLTYWNKLDEIVEYIDSKGMVADLIITNPYSKSRVFGTDAQDDRFVNYTVARYAAYTNVMWHLCWEWEEANDYSGTGTNKAYWSDFNRLGLLVRNGDPWMADGAALRPLTIHDEAQAPYDGMEFDFFDQGWATQVSKQLQSSTPTREQAAHATVLANFVALDNLNQNMPVSIDEYGYIGSGASFTASRTDIRTVQWAVAAAGAYGTTGDWRTQTDTSTNPVTTWKPAQTGEWADAPDEYGDLKRMIDFFTNKNIEYWKMVSKDELKLSTRPRDYVLAEPGRQYLLYTAAGGTSVQLDLRGYASTTFNAWKYDPTSGTMTSLGPIAGGAWRAFNLSALNAAGGTDWVVLVTTRPIPEPGTLSLLGIGMAAGAFYVWRRKRAA